jgi:ubiquinone/menaquinone biosynthesis C-methylase UbiE
LGLAPYGDPSPRRVHMVRRRDYSVSHGQSERTSVLIPTDTPATTPAQVQMMQLLYGSLVTHLITVVAELGVADLMADQPCPVEDLAGATGAKPDALYRALRMLASYGVFTEVTPRTFGLTQLGDTLRTGVPGSLRAFARYCGLAERQHALVELAYSVRTGLPAFDHVHGTNWWSYLTANPQHNALFNDAMGYLARQLHAATIETYDLSNVRRLVDVGGGHGHLVSTIIRRYPSINAVVFDQPHVVAGAEEVLTEAGIGDRVEFVGGDFFDSVPTNADAYVLSMILHDWSDTEAVAILRNVRQAMDPAGKILVIDAVIPDGDNAHFGKMLDIIMLACHTGRERTEAEFTSLFEAAGLRHFETRITSSPTSVIVAVPAEN